MKVLLRVILGLLAGLAAAPPAAAVPSLRVRYACTDPGVGAGAAQTVSLDFAAGGASVGGLGFTLVFDPVALSAAPTDVAAGAALPAGTEVVADEQAPPGSARVLVYPGRVPVPALTDGEVVRLTLHAAANAPTGCLPVTLTSATFSNTLEGFQIPGSAESGALQVVSCGSCVDADADVCTGSVACDAATGACNPVAAPLCQGDRCTAARCEAARGCVLDPFVGRAAVTCRLDAVDDEIATAPAAALRDKLRAKLRKKVSAIRSKLRASDQTTNSRRKRKLCRMAGNALVRLPFAIEKGVKKDGIDPALAEELSTLAAEAKKALDESGC